MTRLAALVSSRDPPPKMASTRFQLKKPMRPQLIAPMIAMTRSTFKIVWMLFFIPCVPAMLDPASRLGLRSDERIARCLGRSRLRRRTHRRYQQDRASYLGSDGRLAA